MNERIRELAFQAMSINQKVSDDSFFVEVSKLKEFEKFAELIVKMCADYADMAQDAGCEYAGDYVAEAMGFGEEEGITEWRAK